MANVKTDIIGYINDSMEMSKDEIFSIVETILFPFPFWAKNHLPVLLRFLSLPDWLSPMSFLNRILINTWLFFV